MNLRNIIILFTVLISFQNYAQDQITTNDLQIILGEWTGTLTYIDYGTKQPYTMPANLIVTQGRNKNQLSLFNVYPNEPEANSKDKIKISKNGAILNNKDVKTIERLSNGQVQITTEYFGKDNNKNALIRNVYLLGKDQFIIRKEVKFENTDDWLKRNEYSYKR